MKEIIEFIQKTVKDANAKGVVIGISGGIDSAVVGELCVRALGKERVYGIILPSKFTPQDDIDDALDLSDKWDINVTIWNIMKLAKMIDNENNKIAFGNLLARLRMTILYCYANLKDYLIVGTTDKSEYFIGYFTKYGDGGVDFEPIIHLTKTKVRELAKELGLPEKIINKKSSPRLWEGHEAEKELGITYEIIDKIIEMHEKTEHKRNLPRCIND